VGAANMIRVGVVGRPSDRRLPTCQWLALRALLAELSEQTHPESGSLPIRLGSLAEPEGGGTPPIRQHLHSLLLKDGLLS
jgi:hypothetical protein